MTREENGLRSTTAHYLNHGGTNDEIGRHIGQWVMRTPSAARRLDVPPGIFAKWKGEDAERMFELFDRHCPGINEEIRGFADTVGVDPARVVYYSVSHFTRGCNVMALRPEKTLEGRTILAYTYDFTDALEEICLAATSVSGRYRHTGSQCNLFGRSNGINEHGLALCQSSNGLPVTNIPMGLDPALTGINFWCVIRTLLENCRDIPEALDLLAGMPIAYNMNLMMGDASGEIALFETLNGFTAYRRLSAGEADCFLNAGNHAVLPEMREREKCRWKNSVLRSRMVRNTLAFREKVSKDDIRKLISTEYPDGLCAHFYDPRDMFGTLYGGIIDIEERTIDIVFGTPRHNPWRSFPAFSPEEDREYEVSLPRAEAPIGFFDMTDEMD